MLLLKKLTKDMLKNKIFIFMLLLLSAFTSFMYFFVHFSIDGNMEALNALPLLNENQLKYKNALYSNIILAQNFLIALTGLTAFVFAMFFYRFYKSNKKQLGCIRSLGYKNQILRSHSVIFTAALSLTGAVIGIASGYLASDILINANMQSYFVTALVKNISWSSLVIGLFAPTAVFCIVTLLSYSFIGRQDTGDLISGTSKAQKFPWVLRLANTFINILPIKNKLPIRIAFRKPLSILLIVLAVMSFTVMFIIGYSLNNSSQKVFSSQTDGHNYLLDTSFSSYKTHDEESKNALYYITYDGIVKAENGTDIEQQLIGMEQNTAILELKNKTGEPLSSLENGAIYVSPALNELYGVSVGDTVTLTINNQDYSLKVQDIAANAKSKSIYISKAELTQILGLPINSYNGILSMDGLHDSEGTTITHEQKINQLERDSVSNRTSAVINQVIGCVVGCILIYLALLLNLQDSTRDMLILHLMGYTPKTIRKLLINVYKPVILASFLLTLIPSIFIAQSVQKSLSIQTGDYMPFQISYIFVIVIFVLLNAIYSLVQVSYSRSIKKIINNENIADYTYTG